MCYALMNKVERGRVYCGDDHELAIRHLRPMPVQGSEPDYQATGHKRRASSPLEHGPSKVAKTSSEDARSAETVCEKTNKESALDSGTATKDVATLESKIQELGERVIELEEERDKWRIKGFKLQDLNKELKEKVKATEPMSKSAELELSKRLERDIKAKQDDKLRKKDTQHKEAMQELRDKQDERLGFMKKKYQDKLNEHKANHKSQQEAKDKAHEKKVNELTEEDRKIKQEWKAFKAEHLKIQKDLKAEQQAKIKEAKPEHSKVVKEKDSTLKQYEKEIAQKEELIAKMDERAKKLTNAVDTLEAEKKVLSTDIETKEQEKGGLQCTIGIQAEAIDSIKEAKSHSEDRYQQKLAHEGQRWQIQYDRAEDLSLELVGQQRATFALRNANHTKLQRIQGLEDELAAVRDPNGVGRSAAVDRTNEAHGSEASVNKYDANGIQYAGDWSTFVPGMLTKWRRLQKTSDA